MHAKSSEQRSASTCWVHQEQICMCIAGSDHSQQQGTAPARPLVTPQGQQQQHWPHRDASAAAAGDHHTQQHIPEDAFPAEAAPYTAAASTTRWLACSYKAGLLGVATYDRLSNEVCSICMLQFRAAQAFVPISRLKPAARKSLARGGVIHCAVSCHTVPLCLDMLCCAVLFASFSPACSPADVR